MAKVGLKYPVYAPLTESGTTVTYGTGAVLAKAIQANISIESNDTPLYADDAIAEIDKSFKSGKVTVGVDDFYDAAKVALLNYVEGAVVDAATGAKELSAEAESSGNYVGYGFYGKVIRNKIPYFRAVWLKKVLFAEPSDENETRGESTAFKTPQLEGSILKAADGKWKEEATFSTEAAAKSWLEGKANITAKCATPASSVASGSYTAAQSVTLTCATSGATIHYTDDGTIPSATNGTAYSAAIALASPSNTCIKAVAIKDGYTASDILELYITVS